MSNSVTAAVIVATPPLLLVLGAMLVRMFVILKTIHLAVNSNMTAAVAEIKAGREELAAMKATALVEIRAEVAQLRNELAERERRPPPAERRK